MEALEDNSFILITILIKRKEINKMNILRIIIHSKKEQIEIETYNNHKLFSRRSIKIITIILMDKSDSVLDKEN
jgi:hypothetical protein